MGASEVFQALGGGLAGLLGAAVLVLFGLLLLSMRDRLKDFRSDNVELKQEKRDLLAKLDPLTNTVERLTGLIEAMGRELERRRGAS